MSSTHKAVAAIRRALRDREDGMPSGTIIRFVRRKQQPGKTFHAEGQGFVDLSYAAVFTNDRWYLTGTRGVGAASYTHQEFMDLLSSKCYTEIAVATEFEPI